MKKETNNKRKIIKKETNNKRKIDKKETNKKRKIDKKEEQISYKKIILLTLALIFIILAGPFIAKAIAYLLLIIIIIVLSIFTAGLGGLAAALVGASIIETIYKEILVIFGITALLIIYLILNEIPFTKRITSPISKKIKNSPKVQALIIIIIIIFLMFIVPIL